MKERKKRMCATLSPNTIEELKKIAQEKHISVSHLIELAWGEYYKRELEV